MPESSTHMSFVNFIYEYMKQIIPCNNSSLILIDSQVCSDSPIPVINGFRPDLIYRIDNQLIIGDAKTDDDVERRHSIDQYYSYLKEAEAFDGDSIVVFCVSWKMFSTLKNNLRVIKRQNSFTKATIIVLNNKGDVSRI